MNVEANQTEVVDTDGSLDQNSGISFSVEEITPERAADITRDASDFRKDDNAIATYAHAMAAGHWILNGQPIIFDRDGLLLDGYQRLKACEKAGVPFRTIVARNVSADTLHTIDQHRRRSYRNVLESRGIKEAGAIQKLMSKMIKIENGVLGKENIQISWSRYDRVLAANPELIEAVDLSNMIGTGRGSLSKLTRPYLAFMAIRAGKKGKAREFMIDMMNSTLDLNNPAKMLSMQLSYSKQRDLAHAIDETIAMSVLAFNDYAAGRKVTGNYFWQPDLGSQEGRKRDDINWREVRKTAVSNLGFPLVDGYPGIREGRIDYYVEKKGDRKKVVRVDKVGSPLDDTIAEAARKDAGLEEVRMVLVTPEIAMEWLRYNDGNRRIQQSHVDAIARDITSGYWMVNAQPICFTTDPDNPRPDVVARLLNGQHRLYAIIKAATPIEIPIAYNIPEEAFATFDTHAKRSIHPKADRVDDRVIASAAKFQWREDHGLPLFDSKGHVPSPSASEIRETLEAHPNLMDGFSRSRRKEMLKVATAGVMTYFIYRATRENAALAAEFLDQLETGEHIPGGSPVLKARNEMRDKDFKASRKEKLKTLLAFWTAFLDWHASGRSTGGSSSGSKSGKAPAAGKAEDQELLL